MARKERVTRVIDGDSFKTRSRKNSVRLANVNAPEKDQRGFSKAKNQLANLIQGQEVLIDTVAHDRFRRSVAKVYKSGKSVNKEMQKRRRK